MINRLDGMLSATTDFSFIERALAYLPQDPGEYPITNKLCDTVLSLLVHPYMEDQNIQLVTGAIKKILYS